MNVILDVYHEHDEIIEDIKKLPGIGDVIEICSRDTSGFRGARKPLLKKYEVVSLFPKNRLILLKDVNTDINECFGFFDILRDKNLKCYNVTKRMQVEKY